jgi:hypothetical protein
MRRSVGCRDYNHVTAGEYWCYLSNSGVSSKGCWLTDSSVSIQKAAGQPSGVSEKRRKSKAFVGLFRSPLFLTKHTHIQWRMEWYQGIIGKCYLPF